MNWATDESGWQKRAWLSAGVGVALRLLASGLEDQAEGLALALVVLSLVLLTAGIASLGLSLRERSRRERRESSKDGS